MSFQMYRCLVLPKYLSSVNCCAHHCRTTGEVTSRYDEEPGQHQLRGEGETADTKGRAG